MYRHWLKRWIEVVAAVLLLLLLAWLFVLIILTYLLTFQLPVFFSQLRIGQHEKPFQLLKFRTLLGNVDLPLQERRFWLGDVLRFFSLDELPQLWNVLKGDMNLIGPRPLPVEYLAKMNEEQRLRHHVRPGITGLAQVSGRHELSWAEKFRLDNHYVRHCSWWLDVRIVFKTLILLVSFRTDNSLHEKPLS